MAVAVPVGPPPITATSNRSFTDVAPQAGNRQRLRAVVPLARYRRLCFILRCSGWESARPRRICPCPPLSRRTLAATTSPPCRHIPIQMAPNPPASGRERPRLDADPATSLRDPHRRSRESPLARVLPCPLSTRRQQAAGRYVKAGSDRRWMAHA